MSKSAEDEIREEFEDWFRQASPRDVKTDLEPRTQQGSDDARSHR